MTHRITAVPADPAIAVDWDAEVYIDLPRLCVVTQDGPEWMSLLDADITIDRASASGAIMFRVTLADQEWPFAFRLTPELSITAVGWGEDTAPIVEWDNEELTLPEFFRLSPPTFYFPDFSLLTGRDYLPAVTSGLFFDPTRIETRDWSALSVDIQCERHNPREGLIAIHTHLSQELSMQSHRVVVYDDGKGEVADFVTIAESGDGVRFVFYHVKASESQQPGERLADVYDVCGQAVKSIRWALSPRNLVERLLSRCRNREAERMVVGTRDDLTYLLEAVGRAKISFEIVIVQPGISRSTMAPDNIALPLASADLFITGSSGCDRLRVLASI